MNYKELYTGGEKPMSLEEFTRLDDSTRAALFSFANAITNGEDAVLYGCTATVSGSITVTPGYILLNGEILEVEAQTVADTLGSGLWQYTKTTTYDTTGTKTFVNGIIRQTWRKDRGTLVNVASITSLSAFGYQLRLISTIRNTIAEKDVSPTLITLTNNFTGGIYYERRDNIVTLNFEAVSRNDANTLMAQLPEAIRPRRQLYVRVAAGTGSLVNVEPDGDIRCSDETFNEVYAVLTYIVN